MRGKKQYISRFLVYIIELRPTFKRSGRDKVRRKKEREERERKKEGEREREREKREQISEEIK